MKKFDNDLTPGEREEIEDLQDRQQIEDLQLLRAIANSLGANLRSEKTSENKGEERNDPIRSGAKISEQKDVKKTLILCDFDMCLMADGQINERLLDYISKVTQERASQEPELFIITGRTANTIFREIDKLDIADTKNYLNFVSVVNNLLRRKGCNIDVKCVSTPFDHLLKIPAGDFFHKHLQPMEREASEQVSKEAIKDFIVKSKINIFSNKYYLTDFSSEIELKMVLNGDANKGNQCKYLLNEIFKKHDQLKDHEVSIFIFDDSQENIDKMSESTKTFFTKKNANYAIYPGNVIFSPKSFQDNTSAIILESEQQILDQEEFKEAIKLSFEQKKPKEIVAEIFKDDDEELNDDLLERGINLSLTHNKDLTIEHDKDLDDKIHKTLDDQDLRMTEESLFEKVLRISLKESQQPSRKDDSKDDSKEDEKQAKTTDQKPSTSPDSPKADNTASKNSPREDGEPR